MMRTEPGLARKFSRSLTERCVRLFLHSQVHEAVPQMSALCRPVTAVITITATLRSLPARLVVIVSLWSNKTVSCTIMCFKVLPSRRAKMGEAEEVKKRKRSAGRGLVRAKEIVVIGLGQTIGRKSKFKRCCQL